MFELFVNPLTTGFDLLDSQNRVVAHATVSGGVATFELTSYADTFNSVLSLKFAEANDFATRNGLATV